MSSSEKHVADAKQKHHAKTPGKTTKRVRLSPEVRRQMILEAALVEFSAMGFSAATTANIAKRAGTTQSNLYVHFSSKDEIFETLLKQVLVPADGVWKPMSPGQSLHDVINAFIDDAYSRITPQSVAVIRLMIAESHRIPGLIQRWYEEAVIPVRNEQQRRIAEYAAAGQMQDSPLSHDFGLLTAPLLYVAVMKMVFPGDIAENECLKVKEAHRKVLHLLLEPPR
ncbi:TetR/AcrR family transcriptional regulator [Brenneria populi subsp. brevivirga]|uniref:TetR/AcrR family transcriptional regulator n=1 Tax=Brenneria populi TaxID=1505588 RepID=UPI002E1955EA|nr:TetR/AcrR family transcriptional regulator [Brenneria populi subsp. brevivirga]